MRDTKRIVSIFFCSCHILSIFFRIKCDLFIYLRGCLWSLIHLLWNALGFSVLHYKLIIFVSILSTSYFCWANRFCLLSLKCFTCNISGLTDFHSTWRFLRASWWLEAGGSVVCGLWLRRGCGQGFGFQRSQQRQRLAMQPCLRHWASPHRPGSLAAHHLRFARISTFLLQSQDSESSLKVLEEISSRDSVLEKMFFWN